MTKRLSGLGFLIALLFLFLTACQVVRTPTPRPASKRQVAPRATPHDTPLLRHYPRVLFIGDDISTLPVGANAGDHFQDQVMAQLRAQDPLSATQSYLFDAMPGIRAGDVISQLIEAPPSDLVIVNLGMNDFGQGGAQPSTLSAFTAGYERILREALKASPNAQLVCLTVWDNPRYINSLLFPASSYDAAITLACQQASKNSRVIDVAATIVSATGQTPQADAGSSQSDGYLPNQENDDIIARALVRSLEA